MKEIVLNFDKSITNLSGNKYGRNVFESQVKGRFDNGQEISIEFPPEIENIASSFIQGFFEELVESVGVEGIRNNIEIKSNNIADAKSYVMKKLMY